MCSDGRGLHNIAAVAGVIGLVGDAEFAMLPHGTDLPSDYIRHDYIRMSRGFTESVHPRNTLGTFHLLFSLSSTTSTEYLDILGIDDVP